MEDTNYQELLNRIDELIRVIPMSNLQPDILANRFEISTITVPTNETRVFKFDNVAEKLIIKASYTPTDDDGFMQVSYGDTLNTNQMFIIRNGEYIQIPAKITSVTIVSQSSASITVTCIVVNNFDFYNGVR